MGERMIVLRRREITKQNECFSIVPVKEEPAGTLMKLRVLCFSVDPVMTVWISGAETYFPKMDIGEVMHCFGLATVLESKL